MLSACQNARMAEELTLADFRVWMRDQYTIANKRFELVAERLEQQSAVLERHSAQLEDLRDESRAQTQALWQWIDRMDRLDPGGGA